MPYPGAFASIHELFRELSDHRFHIRHKPWVNAYELAALTNYVAMFGTDKRNHKPFFSLDKPLNEFKKLWKLAEEGSSYSDNSDYIAAFILRIIYQQLPFVIHSDRIPSMFSRMSHLFSTDAMNAYAKRKLGVGSREFFQCSQISLRPFLAFTDVQGK